MIQLLGHILLFSSMVGITTTRNSSMADAPSDIIHKIAKDYASNQDLFHLSQCNNRYRAMFTEVIEMDLNKIESDYAAITINNTVRAIVIFNKFYHLGDDLSISELVNKSIASKSVSCMFRGRVKDISVEYFPFLAFVMKDRLQPSEIIVIIYAFKDGQVWEYMPVDMSNKARIPVSFKASERKLKRNKQNYHICKIKIIVDGTLLSLNRRKFVLANKCESRFIPAGDLATIRASMLCVILAYCHDHYPWIFIGAILYFAMRTAKKNTFQF